MTPSTLNAPFPATNLSLATLIPTNHSLTIPPNTFTFPFPLQPPLPTYSPSETKHKYSLSTTNSSPLPSSHLVSLPCRPTPHLQLTLNTPLARTPLFTTASFTLLHSPPSSSAFPPSYLTSFQRAINSQTTADLAGIGERME